MAQLNMFSQHVSDKAASIAEKASVTIEKGKASAEERGMRHAKQLEDIINNKVAFIEEKTRSTYSALDSSATKFTQLVSNEAFTQQANAATGVVADKTKAAANVVRTKSGELASAARTKSEQLASSTRGKLQAAGQGGLKALAKTFSFSRGGA